jgi:Protein of unknown function (DUF2726)
VDMTLIIAAVCAVAVIVAWTLYKQNRQLRRRINGGYARPFHAPPPMPMPWKVGVPAPAPPPPKSAEQMRADHLDRQLEAVIREHVTFTKRRIMNRGEYELFRSAMGVTRQPFPTGTFPFFVFPQVSLGQIIGTGEARDWQAEMAYRAINSKRCDLLIADRYGNPLAVLEYQGSGHNIGGTAQRRDEIKRIALERAGVRYIEIKEGTTPAAIQSTIRDLMTSPDTTNVKTTG